MANFYIERIMAHGDQRSDAVVPFGKGLNIIQGYSDTGKTCIIKCIDFIFGSSEVPFDKSTGYSKVTMTISTDKGSIDFSRTVGKNQVYVVSGNEDIDSGTYDLTYKKNQKNPVLNSVWLKLLGIDGEPMIVKNSDFERKHLTWRTMLQMLLIHEEDIARSSSIVVPEQHTEKTLFLSALLYLVTGRDFAENDAQTKKEIRVARRKAVEEYVNKQLSGVVDRRKNIAAQLDAVQGIDVEAEVTRIVEELKKTDVAITEAVNNSKELLAQVLATEEKAAECTMLLSRYKALRSQYTADVHRLTFIVEGEVGYQGVPQSAKCPFCEGKIPVKNRTSYVESARSELSRIMGQMKGLSETEADVQAELAEIEVELKALQEKRKDIEALINENLRPKADELQTALEKYQVYIRLTHEVSVIDSFKESWMTDLRQLPPENTSELKYHPKEYFDEDFLEAMDTYAYEILEECHYENLSSARFNLTDFDIEVNGGKKATKHGKGYRAFLNTVVALMFRKYLCNDAKYNPGLLIIDTPLLGLDQGVDDAAPESMRTALFTYFINHQNEGQVIVIENLDHIPNLNYKESGANIITFTKGRSEGRYGFLESVF